MIRYGVPRDTSICSKTDLNAVLRRAGCRPDSSDDVIFNPHLGTHLVRGDAVLLVIMDAAAFNFYDRCSTASALDQNPQAALAAIQTRAQFHIADGHALDFTRRVLVQDADKIRRARRDAVVSEECGLGGRSQ